VTAERDAFGPRLRRERESRGITLEAIAGSTKISRSLLAALERNDVSRWPLGIFRRSFVREYAAAIGLAPEPIVAEFVRLFPEPGADPPPAAAGAAAPPPPEPEPSAPLRLTLAGERFRPVLPAARPALVAFADAAGVLLLAALGAWLTRADLLSAVGVIALVYYTTTTAITGKTGAAMWLAPAGPPALVDQPAAADRSPVRAADERSRASRRDAPSPRRAPRRNWAADSPGFRAKASGRRAES